MAPRKEKDAKDAKAERITGSEAADLVLKYLTEQNRPYSANDVSANLHNKVTKAAATKLLKELSDKELLICRAAGKQLVYHVPQTADDAATPEHLAALDTQVNTLKTNTASALAEAKTLRSTISTLGATVPLSDLRASVQILEQEVQETEERLAGLRGGEVVPVSAEEREALDAQLRKFKRAEKARKKIVKEMWATIVDGVGDKEALAELRERLGLDE
ncbi:Tat binding protein 1-interacting protein-domain-containing protein [Phyllosticta capitalensis]|uniref:Tat binding protein 1-interacting protein-domain-containing protein n=1 Tax=Phyllosticta capitalensis TaxID=121624 RepID=UPI00312CE522